MSWRRVPEPLVRRRHPVEPIEDLLGAAAAVVFGVVPLCPGGEALVEPDLGPALQPDRVAEPLVRGLVDDRCDVNRAVSPFTSTAPTRGPKKSKEN